MEFNEFLFSLRALHCHCIPVACYFRMSLRLFVACHVFTVTGVTVANTFTSVNTSTQQLWGISMVLTDAQSGLKTHADKFNLLWFWRIVDTPKDRSVFNHYQQSQSQIRLWPAHTNVHLALLSFNFLLSVSQPLTVPSRIQRQSSVGATLATCAHMYGMHKITETQEKPTTALTRKCMKTAGESPERVVVPVAPVPPVVTATYGRSLKRTTGAGGTSTTSSNRPTLWRHQRTKKKDIWEKYKFRPSSMWPQTTKGQ